MNDQSPPTHTNARLRRFARWLAVAALTSMCCAAQGSPAPDHAVATLEEQSVFLEPEDPQGKGMSFDEIRRQDFAPYEGALNKGFRTGPTWVRVKINPGNEAGNRLILLVRNYLLRASEALEVRAARFNIRASSWGAGRIAPT